MAETLRLRKRADKSAGGEKPEGGWPLSHVEILNDPPSIHVFSDNFVDKGVQEGWINYAGTPMSYEVSADPLGPMKQFGTQTIDLPGDRLVLSCVKDGEQIQVVYRIVRPPIPRHFRVPDTNELSGWRATHQYDVELEG